MSRVPTPVILIDDFLARFNSVSEAAEEMEVSRQTWYDWKKQGKHIPKRFAFRAKAVLDEMEGE